MRYDLWTPPPWYATKEVNQIHPLMYAKELEWQLMLDCSPDDFKESKEARAAKKEVQKNLRHATNYLKTMGKNGVLLNTSIK